LSRHIRNDQKGPRRTVTAEELETHFRQGLLRPSNRRAGTNAVLCLDLCDMRNEHARKIEFLDHVLDGSAGEVHAGYRLGSVIGAEVHGSQLGPSTSSFFSVRAQDFVRENEELLSAIDQLNAQTRGRARRFDQNAAHGLVPSEQQVQIVRAAVSAFLDHLADRDAQVFPRVFLLDAGAGDEVFGPYGWTAAETAASPWSRYWGGENALSPAPPDAAWASTANAIA
jgi:hypothetical protein